MEQLRAEWQQQRTDTLKAIAFFEGNARAYDFVDSREVDVTEVWLDHLRTRLSEIEAFIERHKDA